MLFSKQQNFMMDALERLGCIRENQLTVMVRQAFCQERPDVAPRLVKSAMSQLEYCNVELEKSGDIYRLRNAPENPLLLEAVDVMLQLSGGMPLDFYRARAPMLLHFSVQEFKVRCFAVARYSAELYSMDFPRSERIILLFDGQGQPQTLPVPNKQFIAVRQEDGSHRFFAKGGK